MRRLASIALVGVLVLSLPVTVLSGPGFARRPDVGSPAPIDPALEAILDAVPGDQPVAAIVILRAQVDPRDVGGGGHDRGSRVVAQKRDRAERTQGPIRAVLAAGLRAGSVQSYTPLWIVNAIAVTAQPAVIRGMARSPLVARIVPDHVLAAPPPSAFGTASGSPVEPNVAQVNAPAMWDLGYRGAGVVVASMDTGVDVDHPDLTAQWRGGANSWYDPYGQHAAPFDASGHGTQTMGVMVGRDSGGTSIGLAPEATWIAVKAFNDSGVASSSALHLGYQWLLDPDGVPATADEPDVVNNSWTYGSPGCVLEFEPDLAALVAAGIVPVFAAGNFGPAAPSDTSPGNNPDAFSVGAVYGTDAVWGQSSRGPTSCGRASPATFPSVAAPGVDVWTASRFGFYEAVTGTSLAAPHVTGAIALLLDAFPGTTVTALENAIRTGTVDLPPAGPDVDTGSGRLDVMAAYEALVGGPTPSQSPSPSVSPSPSPSSTSGDSTGPLTGPVSAAPNPTDASTDVAIAATADDSASGGAAIVAAEYFVDAAGSTGSGQPMSGSFGPGPVTVSATIPASSLAGLADGMHQLFVRARDGAGNWGPLSVGALVIDRAAPQATSVTVNPTRTDGAATVTVTAIGDDSASGSSPIVAGEAYVDTDPGAGAATPLDAADGSFDAVVETLTGTLLIAGTGYGEHLLGVRVRDAAGTWGAASMVPLLVTPADTVFADGFESGSTAAWSSVTGASRLSVGALGPAAGRYALTATLAGKSASYVVDDSPSRERAFRARFALDPSSADTAGRVIGILTARTGGTDVLTVQFRRLVTGPEVRAGARRSGGWTYTPWTATGPGWHPVEVGWSSSTTASLTLLLDGASVGQANGLDTSRYAVDSVRLGPSGGLGTGVTGTLRFDHFVSTRSTQIGP